MSWDPWIADEISGKRVLLTGHTGFKGFWLRLWLESLGAQVAGLSLPAEPGSMAARSGLAGPALERLTDIRDRDEITPFIVGFDPDLILHLAAQPLVSAGYQDPVGTFETNVVGTMNVLEAARGCDSLRGCIIVTTDKVYRPSTYPHRHSEDEPLGGIDPYSASKSSSEHVVSAWRELLNSEAGIPVAAVRAGNVIGGGDFARHRLMPDLIRAFMAGRPAEVRSPGYVRPWQHVLDPLAGYLKVAACLVANRPTPPAINFGPDSEASVAEVADLAAASWGDGATWVSIPQQHLRETEMLALDSELAGRALNWFPRWDTREAVERTTRWWKSYSSGQPVVNLCMADVANYCTVD